jgi:hypothetical protein
MRNGSVGTLDLLAGEKAYVGASSMTVEQFMDITMLHELGHKLGVKSDQQSVETQMWKDCFK